MTGKRRWGWLFWVLLTASLALLTGWFRYYPQYQKTREPVHISEEKDDSIRLMSQNLRCLTPLDLGKKSWFYRAPLIIEQIKNTVPGIIGFQEATSWQYEYLCDVLTEYDSVISYRDISVLSEGCPVFFNKTRYVLVESGSFWLSETPEVMSKSWDSREYRICSYVVLEDSRTRREFAVFNTHLDHVSEEARIQGIQVILDRVKLLGNLPFVIMGDLNAQEDSQTYNMAIKSCRDARYEAEMAAVGPTYQNWGTEDKRIDYFLVSPGDLAVKTYLTLPAEKDGAYFSDHNGIVMDMMLNQLRVMSYNIRVITSADEGDRGWEVRRDLVLDEILQQKPDILCLQEVKAAQQADLEMALSEYDSYIVFRDNTKDSEGCPVFWNKEKYILLDKGVIWLSETPEVISKGWNAAYPRICTYIILKDRETQRTFGVFNIHLDHASEEAREKGMAVVLDLLKQFPVIPRILTGDFNESPDSPAYHLATRDLEDGLHQAKNTSGYGTYHQWGKLGEGRRIDYIMLSRESFRVFQYHVVPALHEGIYASDHSPVVMDAWFA